jgi:hypothetical protein
VHLVGNASDIISSDAFTSRTTDCSRSFKTTSGLSYAAGFHPTSDFGGNLGSKTFQNGLSLCCKVSKSAREYPVPTLQIGIAPYFESFFKMPTRKTFIFSVEARFP